MPQTLRRLALRVRTRPSKLPKKALIPLSGSRLTAFLPLGARNSSFPEKSSKLATGTGGRVLALAGVSLCLYLSFASLRTIASLLGIKSLKRRWVFPTTFQYLIFGLIDSVSLNFTDDAFNDFTPTPKRPSQFFLIDCCVFCVKESRIRLWLLADNEHWSVFSEEVRKAHCLEMTAALSAELV